MEAKEVYMTEEQINELRAEINAIEGLTELKAAIDAWNFYMARSAMYLQGDIDERPVKPTAHIGNLKKQYPRAAAYLKAEQWIYSNEAIKVRLGSRACARILDGDDYAEVLEEMKNAYAAFKLAQEG